LLRYFRINDPYRLVGLLVLLLMIYLPLFLDPPSIMKAELQSMLLGEQLHEGQDLYADVVDNSAPLSAWFHALMDVFFGRSITARHILAFIIILFQSIYLGIIFITNRVFNENTFIPTLIFSLLYFFSFDTLALTDELLGSGFLLLSLNSLFKEIEFRMPRDETPFNIGLYISLASLFFLPYLIFLFGALVSLFLFARTNARKIGLLIFGFLLPHLFVIAICYLNGSLGEAWEYYYMNNLAFGAHFLVGIKGLLILGLVPIFFLIISIVMLNRLARFSKYQSQLLQSIFLWFGFCFIFFLFCQELRPQTLIVLIPPATFLLTHFLLLIRRKKFAEMNTWLLLIGIVSIAYLARYDKLKAVDYGNLFVERTVSANSVANKKILVLDGDLSPYLNNKPATGFIDWKVASDIFQHPEFYDNVITVSKGFKKDAPDVVIDEQNYLKAFLDRIPEIKSKYRKTGVTYVRIQ
jgi:hypothetical protein